MAVTFDAEQRAAVESTRKHTLVIAGPGSGKTRVLAGRIAHVLEILKAPSSRMLCLTFSNRAAEELRTRIGGAPGAREGPWIATFHSLCLHVLRREVRSLPELAERFSVWGGSAQRRTIRGLLKDLGFDHRAHPAGEVLHRISRARISRALEDDVDVALGDYRPVLEGYEQALRKSNALDFDGLLIRALELFRTDSDVRIRWRDRFDHILVDEAQDTSAAQWRVLRHLTQGGEACTFIVGDPDQSIYGWRGADPGPLLRFDETRADAKLFRLERNYRSSANILEAADALISVNEDRLEKSLLPTKDSGDEILSVAASSASEEARAIATILQGMNGDGTSWNDMAVLYRSNAQSRLFESFFARWRVPYRVVGSVDFFERREIQDVIAYLTLVDNPRDQAAFWRVLEAPKQGVGDVSRRRLKELVDGVNFDVFWKDQTTLPDAIHSSRVRQQFKGRTRIGLEQLSERLAALVPLSAEPAYVAIEQIIETLRETEWLDAMSNSDDGGQRLENLEELLQHARAFDERYPDDGIAGFLSDVALVTRDEEGEETEEKEAVQLMTLHASKGAEFNVVVIAGMEEDQLPHGRSLGEKGGEEEERRLLFVGMTRAKRQLILTWARSRLLAGTVVTRHPSRFFSDVPADLVAKLAPDQLEVLKTLTTAPMEGSVAGGGFTIGDAVRHSHYGSGRVVGFMSRDSDARILVDFETFGPQELFLAYTSLAKER